MNDSRRPWLIVLIVVVLAGGAFVAWRFWPRFGPPTLERDGGTMLVFEIEQEGKPEDFDSEQMAAAIKRRVDRLDLEKITVKPAEKDRFEIIVPGRGEVHRALIEDIKQMLTPVGSLEFRMLANPEDDREAWIATEDYYEEAAALWQELRSKVALSWPPAKEDEPAYSDVEFGDYSGLIARVRKAHPEVADADVRAFVDRECKGKLVMKETREAWEKGMRPPLPRRKKESRFPLDHLPGRTALYEWVALGRPEIQSQKLEGANDQEVGRIGAAEFRHRGKVFSPWGSTLLLSRRSRAPGEQVEYFALSRLNEPGEAVTGAFLADVSAGLDHKDRPTILFQFNEEGGKRFFELTSKNASRVDRDCSSALAVVLDREVMTAPILEGAIREHGRISGQFTREEVDRLVNILRSGALPAKLKPKPVSEVTIEPKK